MLLKLSLQILSKDSFDKPMGGIDLDIRDLDEDDGDFLLAAELPGDDKHKQATTHINVASDEVLKSTGDTREKWLNAGQNEIDNLTVSRTEGQKKGALSTITPQEKERLRSQAKKDGSQCVELQPR